MPRILLTRHDSTCPGVYNSSITNISCTFCSPYGNNERSRELTPCSSGRSGNMCCDVTWWDRNEPSEPMPRVLPRWRCPWSRCLPSPRSAVDPEVILPRSEPQTSSPACENRLCLSFLMRRRFNPQLDRRPYELRQRTRTLGVQQRTVPPECRAGEPITSLDCQHSELPLPAALRLAKESWRKPPDTGGGSPWTLISHAHCGKRLLMQSSR
jgi:hypothetical protein